MEILGITDLPQCLVYSLTYIVKILLIEYSVVLTVLIFLHLQYHSGKFKKEYRGHVLPLSPQKNFIHSRSRFSNRAVSQVVH